MMNQETYQAISCASYDKYELAIMRKTVLPLRWRDDRGQVMQATLLPLDLRTERGYGEFLLAQDREGRAYRIRLDHILSPPPE